LIGIFDRSDVSQDFRPADILVVPQAIKCFDESDFFMNTQMELEEAFREYREGTFIKNK